jgi:four helix bundle protein
MVRRFEELVARQLSVELCEVIFEITEEGKAAADTDFQSQIRNAAKAAPSLIAEGFVRFTTPEMVRYLRMARGELGEVQSNLEVGRRTKYFSTAESGRAETLARRAMGTTTSLLKSKLRQLEAEARAKQKKSLKP